MARCAWGFVLWEIRRGCGKRQMERSETLSKLLWSKRFGTQRKIVLWRGNTCRMVENFCIEKQIYRDFWGRYRFRH